MKEKYYLGFLILVILTSSVYILMPNNVRIDVGTTSTTFKVYENNSWVLSGVEYVNLFDGTTKMRASSRSVDYAVLGNESIITRVSDYKDNITVIEKYFFNGSNKDVSLVPVNHTIEVQNAVRDGPQYILQYEVQKLTYTGITDSLATSPKFFGHRMKVTWDESNYYAKVYRYADKEEGKLTVKYRIDSPDYQTWAILSDPFPSNSTYVYELDEAASASGIIIDATGTANGTNNGASNVSGKLNSAYDFVPAEHDSINFSFQWPDDTQGTACTWVNPDVSTVQIFLDDRNESGEYMQLAQINSANFLIRINDGTSHDLGGNASLSPGTWYFICGTWGSNGMRLYQNGVLVGQNAYTGGWVSNSNMVLGVAYGGVWQWFDGKIDQTSFFSTQLTPSEISDMWNSSNGLFYDQSGGGGGATDNLTIALVSPVDTYNTTSSDITLVGSVNSTAGLTIANVSLYIDGVLNETNSSGVEGEYSFSKTISGGEHNWTIKAFSNESVEYNTTTRTFTKTCLFNGFIKDSEGNALEGANVTIWNQNDHSEYYDNVTDANGYWSYELASSSKTWMVGAYFNSTLLGGIKPYVSGSC